ncbi:MAG: M3 family metallopeptidase [Alphaproteobacteria bacterium]|jgi:peptidyl-dipeptidase Dcp|nr:M3 family metallopeptidase [Alphaproteobacteria bacterium]
MTENPLLSASTLPNKAPAFSKIKTEHFMPAIQESIKEAYKNIEAIKENNDAPSFENTIVALETASETLGIVTSIFYNQLSANGNDELQALAEQVGPATSNFSNDIMHDAVLFERVKAVYDSRDTLDLSAEEKTLLEDTYMDFVRSGAMLNDDDKKRYREISERQSILGPTFMNNVKKSSEQFKLWIDNKSDLAGLPESAIDGAKQAAEDEGEDEKWLFTLDIPSYMPFMQYAQRRDLREKMWLAFSNRAWKDDYDNADIILETVRLRHEKAGLLGYNTHADYVLERRMAETPANVFDFLTTLRNAYRKAAEQDLADIKAFAKDTDGLEDIKPWDIGYYGEKRKEKLFDFSSEDFRPYFPIEKVLSGTFDHFSKLFGLTFTENKAYDVWHDDVKAFDVEDKSGRFIGTLYADFYPRSGKKPGAWMTPYRSQGLYQGKVERPIIGIVCNFTKPTKTKPSLLTHDEVLTLFHEMGHAVHGLLSDVTYQSLAGTNVLWDFVELPSQVQENWIFTKETLDMLSGHYQTGEKLPQALIDKLNESKNYMIGWIGLRQISFGRLDMMWHTSPPEAIVDVATFEETHTKEDSFFPRLGGPFSSSFGHIFAGAYSAGYYSYKWAQVLDADTFEAFLEKGLYDQKVANDYKEHILSKGATEPPQVLYKRFRGRDADPKALLRREGLAE